MSEQDKQTTINTVKTASDGTVKIAVERYNELLERSPARRARSVGSTRSSTGGAKPPVINRTVVEKTAEMLAREYQAWGATFMGLGASMFVVGALFFRAGRAGS